MVDLLDKILLSDDVIKNFYDNYNNAEFNGWLNSILPEVENCKNLKQDNPWHIYNCLDHILHSVEEINKQTKDLDYKTRRLLAYTMFLHDIGKPECYIRRYSKLYKREVDSFFNHNIAGVKIAQRVLSSFMFNELEQNIIKKLVLDHDMFMFITLYDDGNKFHKVLTKKLVEDKINELNDIYNGKTMMKYLLMVGTADNKAQNPKMTKDSLILFETMKKMVDEI